MRDAIDAAPGYPQRIDAAKVPSYRDTLVTLNGTRVRRWVRADRTEGWVEFYHNGEAMADLVLLFGVPAAAIDLSQSAGALGVVRIAGTVAVTRSEADT